MFLVLFPAGLYFDKETDDIEPLSRNEFLFARYLNPMNYEEKESGQTADFCNLSALAPQSVELLNIWWDFLKVVEFIDDNRSWLLPLLDGISCHRTR